MKNNKQIWMIAIIIIGIILVGYSQLFVVVKPLTLNFYQFTGTACGIYYTCTSPDLSQIYASTNSSFYLGGNIIKFSSQISSGNLEPASIYNTYCKETIRVYKNDELIDTLFITPIDKDNKCYYYDGTSDNICNSSKRGVLLNPLSWSSVDGYNCQNIQNSFTLLTPANSFDLRIYDLNATYYINDSLKLKINLTNRFNPTNAALLIRYDLPTIIGTKTEYVEKNVSLVMGTNLIEMILPTNYPTINLSITPQLVVYYPTSNLNKLNYNDGYFKAIQPNSEINIMDVTFDKEVLSIINRQVIIRNNVTVNQTVNQTVYVDRNITQNVTVNQTVYVDRPVEVEQTFLQKYGLALVILIIAGGAFAYFWRKK